MNWMIIAAGGDGQRMKVGTNKALLPILDKPLAFYTLTTLEEIKLIDKIIVVIRPIDKEIWQQLISRFNFQKIMKLISAAKNRQDSTWKALQWLKKRVKNDDLIGVHNAVNPLATSEEIKKVFRAAKESGAALLAMPARDTVKIADNNHVKKTPLRQFVWYAQTPQIGRFDLMFRAFQKAQKEKFIGTDDSQLLERIGVKVKIVPCSAENFKITYPQDVFLAEEILKQRRKK